MLKLELKVRARLVLDFLSQLALHTCLDNNATNVYIPRLTCWKPATTQNTAYFRIPPKREDPKTRHRRARHAALRTINGWEHDTARSTHHTAHRSHQGTLAVHCRARPQECTFPHMQLAASWYTLLHLHWMNEKQIHASSWLPRVQESTFSEEAAVKRSFRGRSFN